MALFSRNISVEVEEDDGNLILKGRLHDQRMGTDLHVIEARMRVSVLNGEILGIEASMPHIPLEECELALETVNKLHNVIIQPGFSDKVREIVGSESGCSHLASLIMNMGNVSVQGRASYVRKHAGDEESWARALRDHVEQLGIIGSCVCWREDGPLVRRWRERLEKSEG